jgi:hypothetical protein
LVFEIFSQITRAALRGKPVKNGKTFWIGSGPVEKFPPMTKGGSMPKLHIKIRNARMNLLFSIR